MKTVAAWFILVAALAAAYLFRLPIADVLRGLPEPEQLLEQIQSALPIEERAEKISAPPPLRAAREAPRSLLTDEGVLRETDEHRAKNGLPPLIINPQLSAAATRKVVDMFTDSYFAHESPSGIDAGDLVKGAGYEFIMIGENLALGNYKDDAALVQAWMESPGHRANILNPKFTEIGVAVMRNTYEGRTTWMAAQEFGRPLSLCPQPDETQKAQIDANQTQLEAWDAELDARRAELETLRRERRRTEHNTKVEEYNALVARYNALLEQTKSLVARYNQGVAAFNACAEA